MINRLIAWCLRERLLVLGLVIVAIIGGLHAMLTAPVDAIPDLGENQVIVSTDWPGRAPPEVESQITRPLSVGLQGINGVISVRASSMFGFSLLTVIFDDDTTHVAARRRVQERLNALGQNLPAGVAPLLGPDATGLGWVYQYYLAVDPAKSPGGGCDLGELRTLQDGYIRRELSSVPGVAEVGGIGGFVKQYQVEVNSAKLRAAGIPLAQVLEAIEQSNLNVGGKTIEENGAEFTVRGMGVLRDATDLGKIVLLAREGASLCLRDVARVELGGDFRRGTLDIAGREIVGGTVVLRSGENTREVIARVKARIAALQPGLPEGITLKPFYDRSDLITRCIATLKNTLLEEILLVALVHLLFLWHFRSILIVTLPLPIAVLGSFIGLKAFGLTANLMSLAGLAIAIGVLVDGAIVLTENVLRRCAEAEAAQGRPLNAAERLDTVRAASIQVGRPVFFAMAIILLAFVPVFGLSGQEGKLFHPLAYAKSFAILAAAVLSITLVPVLCTVFMRGPFHGEERIWIMRPLQRIYGPVLDVALRRPAAICALATAVLACALFLAFGLPRAVVSTLAGYPRLQRIASGMGHEFMPPLNEGALLYMPTFFPGTSLTEVKRVMAWQDRIFASVPEVASAVGKLGRADTATDPAPVEMIETTILLKPEHEWRTGLTQQGLILELTEKLRQVPGSVPGFLQPIQARVLMSATGIRAQLGVKLVGDDLIALEYWAGELEQIVRDVDGASGVASSRVQRSPGFEIEADRDALLHYGLRAQDVTDLVDTGLGGKQAGVLLENGARVPIQVRLQRSEREDLERIRDLLLTTPTGRQVALGRVAKIRRAETPNEIATENGRLRVYVQANVDSRRRDLGSFVEEVKRNVARELVPRLPKGMTVDYAGEHENQLHAAATLRLIIPAVLVVIFLLLTLVYRRAADAAHVILAVPFALSGGVFLQHALGIPFSVAVWVGYIALFGTAIQTAMVMVVYLDEALQRARQERGDAFGYADLLQAAKDGARLRLRPKIMTVATIVAGLLPMLWSTSAGAEVLRPIAVPVIGGMLSSLVHILILTPALFVWLHCRELKPPASAAKPAIVE